MRRVMLLAWALGAGAAACAPVPVTERAASLARRHEEEEGIRLLRAHLAENPDDLAARRMLVRMLALASDLNGARAEVEQLAARLPKDDPVPWIELGHAFELVHRFDEALAAYDTASSVAPASPAGPREGGMRCARWGELDEARPRLEDAVRRGARDAETWHVLGLVRVHQGDLDAADDAYKAGISADPKGTENWLGRATVAVMREDGAGALEAYDAILARRPSFAPAELGRAWALAKLGRRDDARRALDKAEQMGAPRENVQRQRRALAE